MKKILMILAVVLFSLNVNAQDKLYLLFEFMHVDNEQQSAYWETEDFWEKIHQERVKNGDIVGWDLWQLQPGGEKQGAQFLTVTVYNDPVKMMSGAGDWNAALKAAYPDMSEEDLNTKFNEAPKTRDLTHRLYLEDIANTDDDFDMPVGTIAAMNMMKVEQGNYGAYEKAENEIFKKDHNEAVKNGNLGSWSLARIMFPYGSDTYASHMTFDMFKDYTQFFNRGNENVTYSEEEVKKMNEGIALRDMKFTYIGTLVKKVR
jgi:hypothetical protein